MHCCLGLNIIMYYNYNDYKDVMHVGVRVYLPTVASAHRKNSNRFVITARHKLLPRWRIVDIKHWNHKVIKQAWIQSMSMFNELPIACKQYIYTHHWSSWFFTSEYTCRKQKRCDQTYQKVHDPYVHRPLWKDSSCQMNTNYSANIWHTS